MIQDLRTILRIFILVLTFIYERVLIEEELKKDEEP